MTDRRRRSAKLVRDVGAALDRGVSPEQVHAALLVLGLPAPKASLLLNRILAARERRLASATAGGGGAEAAGSAVGRAAGRLGGRRRTALFLAFASTLVFGGFTGVVLTTRQAEARERAAAQAAVARLDSEVVAVREHMAHVQERLAERRQDAEKIEWLRARVARGPASFASLDDYEDMLAIYERRRTRWNRTLPQSQIVADAFRRLVEIHNAKVDSLNAIVRETPDAAPFLDPGDGYMRIAATEGRF